MHLPDKFDVIREAVDRAQFVVAFSPSLSCRLRHAIPALSADKVVCLPQAVDIPPCPAAIQSMRSTLRVQDDCRVMLLPGAIRKVKDPLFLLDAVRMARPRWVMVLAGPVLEKDVGEEAR